MLKKALLDRSLHVKNNKTSDAVSECKEIRISPVRAIPSPAAICFQGGAGNSDHVSNCDHMISKNNNALSYVVRQVE